jgi:glycosyltransferase involved in cell wall biosynthesis
MRILHVTEALGGGVWNVLKLVISQQTEAGHEVTLVHSIRADTPSDQVIDTSLPGSVKRIVLPMVSNISPVHDLKSLRALLKIFGKKYDVIHLHSSKAGVLGRVANFIKGNKTPCFYTPHGFSFLRQDVSQKKRSIFRFFEKISAKLSGITLACSETESAHAQTLFSSNQVALIENAIDIESVQAHQYTGSANCRVATSGRLSAPKNPAAFARLAENLNQIGNVEFLWIGGGELEHDLLVDGKRPDNLTVTGWVTGEAVNTYLQSADIFVMTSLWEGMPLSLLEAQTAGLPAVVPNVEGCRDVVIDGVTGYICNSEAEMAERVQQLIEKPALRRQLGEEARRRALIRFAPERMHREIMRAYQAEIDRKSGKH